MLARKSHPRASFILHNTDYPPNVCTRVDSHPKCKFCIETERCTEAYEWDAATLT